VNVSGNTKTKGNQPQSGQKTAPAKRPAEDISGDVQSKKPRSDTQSGQMVGTTGGENKQLQTRPNDQRIRLGGGDFGSWGLIPSLGDFDPFGMFPLSSRFGFDDDWFDRQTTALANLRTPTMDFYENDKTYDLSVDLPGLTKDNVKVNLEGRVLTVSAEQKQEENRPGRYQRQYGTFTRQLVLPDNAIPDKINARMEHGQLKIAIPKQEGTDRDRRAISVE